MKKLVSVTILGLLLIGLGAGVEARAQSGSQPGVAATPQAQGGRDAEFDENEALRKSAVVKKLGSMMGMAPETASTLFEVANFAVLALALGWFMAKALPQAFRDRNSEIQKHLVDARTATEEASARLSSVEERLAMLDGQIAEMRVQAEKDAVAEEQRMRAAVESEKVKILAAADQEIASASLQAQRSLQKYAAELAIEQAARKLVVSAETDRLLVQSFARRLGGDDSNGGQN
jgi:F-type H+-transporting ATPase subunit b